MIVRPQKSRIEFERLIRKLGYRLQQPVSTDFYYEIEKVLPEYTQRQIDVSIYIKLFRSKKSFVYIYFLEISKKYSKKEVFDKVKTLCERLDIKTDSQIGEVGWRVDNQFVLRFWTFEQLSKLYIQSLKEVRRYINFGFTNTKPRVNDVLVSYPCGVLEEVNKERTLLQRGHINQRFGFSPLDEDGYQFGVYDSNLKLRPI